MEHCHANASEVSFKLLRPMNDPTSPWLPWIFGCNAVSIWYWCTDQLMVQRTLSAKNLTNAQGGALFASALKVLPLFFMIVPGMFARILFPEEIACIPGEHCVSVCGQAKGCSNFAFPWLIVNILPRKGFIIFRTPISCRNIFLWRIESYQSTPLGVKPRTIVRKLEILSRSPQETDHFTHMIENIRSNTK